MAKRASPTPTDEARAATWEGRGRGGRRSGGQHQSGRHSARPRPSAAVDVVRGTARNIELPDRTGGLGNEFAQGVSKCPVSPLGRSGFRNEAPRRPGGRRGVGFQVLAAQVLVFAAVAFWGPGSTGTRTLRSRRSIFSDRHVVRRHFENVSGTVLLVLPPSPLLGPRTAAQALTVRREFRWSDQTE